MSEKQGTIVQVMGPVVDVAFDGGALPELKDCLLYTSAARPS